MKIALVLDTTLDSDAGVQQHFKGLARFLLKSGHDIKFLVPASEDRGEFTGKIISFGKKFNPLGNVTSVPIAFLIGGGKKIKEVLEKENFDIIHVSVPLSPFLGAKIIKAAKCPIVITYMSCTKNWLYRLGAIFLKIWMRGVYKKIGTFIALSDAARKEAEVTIPGKYKVIPSGVDISRFSPRLNPIDKFSDGKLNLLFLGRLEERKGGEYLIKAFKKVKSEVKNTRLIIVGDGPLRKSLEELVQKLKLRDVVFEGYIDEKLKPNYYSSACLCVFPAIYGESFGIVLIESIASGKVTIAFANEGYKCVLKNLPELLVENRNIDKLASKIIKFLKDKKLRNEYEKRCLIEAERFKWEHVGNQILNIFSSLLET